MAQVRLYIDPKVTFVGVNQEFELNVNVENVENLAAYQISLCWNPFVLVCVAKTGTDFFPGTLSQAPGSPNNAEGWLVAYSLLPKGVSGSGTLFKVKFRAIDRGVSPIEFCNVGGFRTLLANSGYNEIPFASESGQAVSGLSLLQGTVSDAATGQPLEAVTVELNGYITLTDPQGHYELTVANQTYTLTARKNGYQEHTQTVDLSIPGSYTKDFSLTKIITHVLSVTSTPQGIPFELYRGTQKIGDYATPFSQELAENTYRIVFPLTYTDPAGNKYQFVRAEYNTTPATNDITLTLNRDLSVIAYYELTPHILTVHSTPSGVTFTLYRGAQKIGDYTTPFSQELQQDTYTVEFPLVHIDPANHEYQFARAEYDTTPSDTNLITLTLDRDISVKAYYELVTQTLTINMNNPEWGKVKVLYDTNQLECTTPPCQYTMPKNVQVTLEAIPNPNYAFDYWQRDNYPPEKENPITFTMDKDYNVTAYFTEKIYAKITGTVKGFLGRPVAEATVTLNTFRTKTKQDGTYLIENIPNGTYMLTVEHWLYDKAEVPIEITEPKTYILDVNLSLRADLKATIAGAASGITLALLILRRIRKGGE